MTDLKTQILDHLTENAALSFSAEKLARVLSLTSADEFTPLVQALVQLEREGKVEVTDDGEFKLVPQVKEFTGVFHRNPKGFGFVSYDPEMPDIFINPDHTMYALTGDEVAVKVLRAGDPTRDQGPEGEITKIITRSYDHVVGEFKNMTMGNFIGEVILKDKKLGSFRFYVTGDGIHPQDNEVVTASIATYPSEDAPEVMTGPALEVIGDKDEPGVDILSVVYAHDVPHEFPKEVLDQANQIPLTVQPEEKAGRPDLTDQPLVTIDSIESKDLDDAVVAWKLDNGNYHLGVHIADVSHYVQPGTPLDEEAFKRGTSVYLTDRVIPMLPRRLSNGICSLNPGEERLAMSCEMEIDPHGNIVSHEIFPSVIRSHARMTYKGVNAILEAHDEKTRQEYRELVPMFETMADLHRILLKHRHQRGAIDFEAPEAKIIVDENGHPTDIQLRDRGLSERMIESFMLAANETVAKHYDLMHVPFLYRIHETPDKDRVKAFVDFLNVFGIDVHGDINNVKPKMLQKVLKDVAGKPEEQMVQVMMLRSMQQAKYSDEELGHFGLGAKYYTHFTSPIRRYSDTMVHRMIHAYLEEGMGDDVKEHFKEELSEAADQTSMQERRSIDTERATNDLKMTEYMADQVGNKFEAVVSSVTSFGMFVQLENTVEGLIHISNLKDDYYSYDEKSMTLTGRATHKKYKVGMPIKVVLTNANVEQHQLDFEVYDPDAKKRPHNDRGMGRRSGDRNFKGRSNYGGRDKSGDRRHKPSRNNRGQRLGQSERGNRRRPNR